MDAGDLKIFQAVAREGSISKAAIALNYVQSNVTTRIRQLEEQLQAPLFRRSNRGCRSHLRVRICFCTQTKLSV
ncbi:LysR family transcriptional regulator [Paenibacillus sp. DCT19]|uniref:helix-turn-helix domain-containing protein n=1 Tax=Paenibacillus sp. DCT19 TaxID=2211212 RepID=UPI0020C554B1|nr:LysR family transcriptional regulator [Paenibacillus sp. DCT19]